MCHDFNISIQFPSMSYWYFLITIASCYITTFLWARRRYLVSLPWSVQRALPGSWSMNRWIDDCPTIFVARDVPFVELLTQSRLPRSKAMAWRCHWALQKNKWIESKYGCFGKVLLLQGLGKSLKKFKCGLWSLQEHGNRRNSAPLRMFMYRQREWGWPARGCPGVKMLGTKWESYLLLREEMTSIKLGLC